MIEIKDISVKLSGKEILNNINLTLKTGEVLSIVGQSGSGKSVLMKTVEGLLVPESGNVFLDGMDIFKLSRKKKNKLRRKMAMLFQGSALLDSLNVFQNIALPLVEHSGLTKEEIRDKVEHCLDLVDLKGIMGHMPSELSGGMKKRVALARAIILQPEFIIYDEPTTGLDPATANEIIDLIIMLYKSEKITPIIITHDFNCLKKVESRIVMLQNKTIIFDGTYDQFINSNDERVVKFHGRD
jgi:phospholipid/cholesterol/gamma-HCH transport system ATP-binding protein